MSHDFYSHVSAGRLVKALRCVSLEAAARSLAQQCRYNGLSSEFYSVAQHSVLLSEQWSDGDPRAIWALLHDLHECVIGDISKPLRGKLLWKVGEDYMPTHALEEMLLEIVQERFGLDPIPADVLKADSMIVIDEMLRLFEHSPFSRFARRLNVVIDPLLPKDAEAQYIAGARRLGVDKLFSRF